MLAKDMSPEQFMEAGCIVCGCLTPLTSLMNILDVDVNFDILIRTGMTQKRAV